MALFGLIDDSRGAYNAPQSAFEIGSKVDTPESVWNMTKGYDKQGKAAAERAAALGDDAAFQAQKAQETLTPYDKLRTSREAALGGLYRTADHQYEMANQFRRMAREPEGTSAAEQMLRRQGDTAFAQQMAMARSGRGPSGAALRNAQVQAANAQGQLAGQAAEMRAAEQARFRAERMQALGAAQGAYLQGSNIANMAQAGMGQMQGADLQKLGLHQQQQLALLGAGDRARAQDYQYDVLSKDLLEKQAANTIARQQLYGGTYGQAGSTGEAGQDLQTAAAIAGTVAMFMSDSEEKKAKTKAEGIGEALLALGGAQGQAVQGGMKFGNAIKGAFQSDEPAPVATQPGQYAGPNYGAPQPAAPNAMGLPAGFRSATGEGFDLRPAQAYTYEYKDPNAPGAAPGVQVGPMAQDLEKTAAGRLAVLPTDPKMVDGNRLTMVNTGAISEQQRRIDELEERMRALSGRAA